MSRLEDLILLNQAGAISPSSAVQTLWGMQDARKARRQEAQQQALAMAQEQQQGLLDQLAGVAASGASEGLGAAEVMPQLQSIMGFAGAQPQGPYAEQFQGGLEALFLPSGLSRVSPSLQGTDLADVSQIVQEEYAAGTTDPAALRELVVSILPYGPNTKARMAPQIDKVVQDALKAARGF